MIVSKRYLMHVRQRISLKCVFSVAAIMLTILLFHSHTSTKGNSFVKARVQHHKLLFANTAPNIPETSGEAKLTSGEDKIQSDWIDNVSKQENGNIVTAQDLKNEEIPSSEFNPFSQILTQNDSNLLNYIRRNYLIPPPPPNREYNLVFRWGDPAVAEEQNKYVLKILGKHVMTKGFFVESGANDGETLSSTLVLERDYKWTGLLVEPDPFAFSELKKKNRKAWITNTCLSPTTQVEKVTFLHSLLHNTRSGIESLVELKPGEGQKVNATCVPFFSLLSALNVDTVDYFVLDIEGAELRILQTIPFDSIFIKVLTIEYEHIPEGPEALMEFMMSKNYFLAKELIKANAADFMFVHNSLRHLVPQRKKKARPKDDMK